jgi:hypothetical protein
MPPVPQAPAEFAPRFHSKPQGCSLATSATFLPQLEQGIPAAKKQSSSRLQRNLRLNLGNAGSHQILREP